MGSSPISSTLMNWFEEKDKLYDLLINQNASYTSVGHLYNVTGNCIKKIAKKFGFPIKPKRKINPKESFNHKTKLATKMCENCGKVFYTNRKQRFCSRQCSSEYKSMQQYKEYLQNPSKYFGRLNIKWLKKFILQEQNNECAICHMKNKWNGQTLIFILDHIDGHSNNNERSNLRLICPNCDSQLSTYKSKNKHSDRIYYHFNHR